MTKIKEHLKGAKTIGIGGHIRPDGDCVGASLAMYQYIKKAFPKAKTHIYLEKPAGYFGFLKGFDEINSEFQRDIDYDVFLCLDCSKDRLGKGEKYFDKAAKTICIDHHISNTKCAQIDYIVPDASSTSELGYQVIEEEQIDRDIAEAIYVGIIHDTGVFRYANTSKKTMEIGGKLIGYGIPFSKIIDETFYEKTYVQQQILGRALLESILFLEGRCIVSVIGKRTMDFYGVKPVDLDGIASQLNVTKGADCAVFLYETGLMEYKVSLRSNEHVNVAKVAKQFGGGGHVRAAGALMKGTVHDVINNLSVHIEKQLQEKQRC